MQAIHEIYPLLQEPKKVVITMHQKPDPDAMGSSLALYHFLKQFGHQVQVISPTNWADFLKWMPGCDAVLDFENNKDREKVDAAFRQDGGSLAEVDASLADLAANGTSAFAARRRSHHS